MLQSWWGRVPLFFGGTGYEHLLADANKAFCHAGSVLTRSFFVVAINVVQKLPADSRCLVQNFAKILPFIMRRFSS